MLSNMGDAAIERHMVACVNESLSLYLMSNARFMCERLVAEFPSEARPGFCMMCKIAADLLLDATLAFVHGIR